MWMFESKIALNPCKAHALEFERAPAPHLGHPCAPSPQAKEFEEPQTYRSLWAAGPGLESNTRIKSL